jgi:hypothetical protein
LSAPLAARGNNGADFFDEAGEHFPRIAMPTCEASAAIYSAKKTGSPESA